MAATASRMSVKAVTSKTGSVACSWRASRSVSRPERPGHPHVGNHHAEFSGAQCFQRPFSGIGRDGVESLAAEEGIEQAALAGVVIHDEDARRFGIFFAQFGCHAARLDKPGAGQKKFPGCF
jgi:hypothetical protein